MIILEAVFWSTTVIMLVHLNKSLDRDIFQVETKSNNDSQLNV
jgi:hypothetical protein